MNIQSLPKDEMASHLGELVSSQDNKIINLHQERKALWICVGILLTTQFLF